ncbi:MAG: protein-L-isoaspartate(D-aspartate) O-methyltransferase [Thermoguttaceae bacterium]
MRIRTALPYVVLPIALAWTCSRASAQTVRMIETMRNQMVDQEIVAAGVKNPRVIEAMRAVPRHEHIPARYRPARFEMNYWDMALPIGESQTISPPFVVAYMTEALDPQPEDKVLEIGTGSGYQAAVLSHVAKEVYTIEIVEPLGKWAARVLARYPNVKSKVGDGYQGWPEYAPFDKIIVTCSPEDVPPKLVEQLREGGRMIVPVGQRYTQNLYLFKKENGELIREPLHPTLFVPMTGEAEAHRKVLPDPDHPKIYNGGFEELVEGTDLPNGWHYLRQGEIVTEGAPVGNNYLRFQNSQPGRGCHALQGLSVNGTVVRKVKLSMRVAAKDVQPTPGPIQPAVLTITFYDKDRGEIRTETMGPWRGTFAWQTQSKVIEMPRHAREAIIRIGLMGCVGEIAFDEISLERLEE